MNLRQALYMKTIAEKGGITAAAKQLYISQPSLSQMLRQIEEEAGVPLFDRSSLSFRPTYAGERYLHAASVLLNTNEILENELREIRGEERGRLRLGISMLRSAQLLPCVLPEFASRFPKVEVSLQEAGSAKLEQLLQEGSVDMALASTEPNNPLLEYRLLQKERIGILAGPASPLAQRFPPGTAISLKETENGRFVALKSYRICCAAQPRPDRPRCRVELPQGRDLHTAGMAGRGTAVLPDGGTDGTGQRGVPTGAGYGGGAAERLPSQRLRLRHHRQLRQ